MNKTGSYLKRIMIRMARGRNRLLRKCGFTGPQMDLLEFLTEHQEEDCTISGAARYFDVKHTSVLHVLKLLESRGLVWREGSEEGGRSKTIYLTEKAKEMLALNRETAKAADECLLEGFSQEERELLETYLERIYKNLYHICLKDREVE